MREKFLSTELRVLFPTVEDDGEGGDFRLHLFGRDEDGRRLRGDPSFFHLNDPEYLCAVHQWV